MTKTALTQLLQDIFSACPGNVIDAQTALTPDLAGMVLFESPLVGFASAADPLFESCRDPKVIGP